MAHKVDLTIRATNGAVWETDDFGLDQRVDHVRKTAVKHFVKAGEMADGDYLLALVAGGGLVDLADALKLDDAGVTAGATLALVARGAQVDG
jgi:hypothetical protein